MKTLKLLPKIFVFICIVFAYMSCEVLEEESSFTTNNISNATFVAQKNINKTETKKRIQGIWNSSKSGDKYKWSFNDNTLSKSTIYSFGEIDNPQSYQIKYLNGFEGEVNEYGDYIYLSIEGSDKGICYQILKVDEYKMIIKTKHGDEIVLTK